MCGMMYRADGGTPAPPSRPYGSTFQKIIGQTGCNNIGMDAAPVDDGFLTVSKINDCDNYNVYTTLVSYFSSISHLESSVTMENIDPSSYATSLDVHRVLNDGSGSYIVGINANPPDAINRRRFLGLRGNVDILIVKGDSTNLTDMSWSRITNTTESNVLYDMTLGLNSSVTFAGATEVGIDGVNMFVSQIDKDGELAWSQRINFGGDSEQIKSIIFNPNHELFGVLGSTNAYNLGGGLNADFLFMELNHTGGLANSIPFAFGTNESDVPLSMVVDSKGNYIYIGYATADFDEEDIYSFIVGRILSGGTLDWSLTYTISSALILQSLDIDEEDYLYLTGTITDALVGDQQAFLMKLSSSGFFIEASLLGGDSTEWSRGVRTINSNYGVMLGSSSSYNVENHMEVMIATFDFDFLENCATTYVNTSHQILEGATIIGFTPLSTIASPNITTLDLAMVPLELNITAVTSETSLICAFTNSPTSSPSFSPSLAPSGAPSMPPLIFDHTHLSHGYLLLLEKVTQLRSGLMNSMMEAW